MQSRQQHFHLIHTLHHPQAESTSHKLKAMLLLKPHDAEKKE